MQWLLRLLGIDEDSLRELRIDDYRRQMVEAESVGERLHAWRCMSREVQNRTPEQVARMEKDRGLT